jgi:hypothetical protein
MKSFKISIGLLLTLLFYNSIFYKLADESRQPTEKPPHFILRPQTTTRASVSASTQTDRKPNNFKLKKLIITRRKAAYSTTEIAAAYCCRRKDGFKAGKKRMLDNIRAMRRQNPPAIPIV